MTNPTDTPIERLKGLHGDIADFMLAMAGRPDIASGQWGPREKDAFEKARIAVNALPDLIASIEDGRLRKALAQWKCPSCGGAKVYTQRGRDQTAEIQTREVPCKVCEQSGLHPIAREALTLPSEPLPAGQEEIEGRARREAFEEAARVAERQTTNIGFDANTYNYARRDAAAAIRALSSKEEARS